MMAGAGTDETKARKSMQKNILSSGLKAIALLLLVAALAACGGRDELKKGTTDVVKTPGQYDLTVLADKDGQFDLQGATLNAEDLRGHIRYRNETGQPVHTMLLKPGEKQKVTNQHIAGLAGIARDLKVDAFVEDNDGRLKLIQIAD
ncbi:MAG TPA: hypothetical protein VIE67_04320 [Rudaea sp.]|jgi:predicted small lipoprotein YifL|uniref:hypothetical protein n=1 Tax=Rudaea sp. TaxID=2136325 RepID=UPI002F91F480